MFEEFLLDMLELFQSLSLEQKLIVIGAAVVAATLIVLFVILFFKKVILRRPTCKKHLRDVEKKFTYLKSLLTGQDAQNVRRLEIISRSNLLYGEIYDKFSSQYKSIFENECRNAENALTRLRGMIVKKDYKHFKRQLIDAKKLIASFEDALLVFDKDLCETLKPEEECRSNSLKIKEQYRIIKQKVADNMSSLEIVKGTFERVFEKIEATFDKFEHCLESADYQEAETYLPKISQVLTALEHAINVLPTLCTQVDKIMPEKIMLLSNDFIDAEKSGHPLFHLGFKKKCESWNIELSNIKDQLKQLRVGGAQETLDRISFEIESLHKQLDQEISDKKYFNENCEKIYNDVVNLEKTFFKMISLLPKINSVYVISITQQNSLEVLKNNITNLGTAKRDLDNYIHSATKQPYSILRQKLDALVADYEIANKGVEDFKAYIDSVKTNSEEAYELVFNYYYRLKQTEAIIREFNIPTLQTKYSESIERCYTLLNEIDDAVKTKPIDVSLVNEKVETLKTLSKILFDDVEKQVNNMKLAESAIVYNNEDRPHQSDVNEKLLALEQDFFDGNFEKVYNSATEIYRNNHVEDKE